MYCLLTVHVHVTDSSMGPVYHLVPGHILFYWYDCVCTFFAECACTCVYVCTFVCLHVYVHVLVSVCVCVCFCL